MLTKSISFLFLLFTISSNSFAQNFMHSMGGNVSVVQAKINTEYEQSTFTMAVTHFSYFPRITMTEAENSSLSVGSPLGVGIGIVNNAYSGSGIYWGFDLPVVVDYNIGCKSSPDNENKFGGYFGAGFGYMYNSWAADGSAGNANSYGPLARAGVRFGLPSLGQAMTIGLYYKSGLEKAKFKTFGFNVLLDL